MGDWTLLHGGALGDACLAIQLALQVPDIRCRGVLRVISRIGFGDLSTCNPAIQRTSSDGLGVHWLHARDASPPPEPLRAELTGSRIINFLAGPDSGVHARLAELRPAALFSVDPVCTAVEPPHVVERWKRELISQGLRFETCTYRQRDQALRLAPELRSAGRHLVAEALGLTERGLLVAISPGSGGRRKCWPPAAFSRVAGRLRAAGFRVLFITGPTESEWWGSAEFEQLRAVAPLLREPNGNQLAQVLAAADLWLGNDAGPGHLAALLGTPTVSLFGPTSPAVWRPLSARGVVLRGDPSAGPDWGIGDAQVLEAIERLAASAI